MRNVRLLAVLVFCVISVSAVTCSAADKHKEHREWEKKALEKETRRAKESQQHHANTERFAKKYGWLKKSHPDEYEALMGSMKKAESAWAAVVKKAESAKSHGELGDAKGAAYNASDEAYLAELTLKCAGSADERAKMTEKSGSKEVEKLAKQLDENEQKMLTAHRAKMEADKTLRKCESEKDVLNKKLREAYEEAKAGGKKAHKKSEKKRKEK